MQTIPLRILPLFMTTAGVLSSRLFRALCLILPLSPASAEDKWITNRTGHLGFRARVFRKADGTWHYTITTRTGWHVAEYRYSHHSEAGAFRYRRSALQAADTMVHQLATLRFAYC